MNVRSIIYGAIKDVEKQLRHDDIAYKVVVRENSVDLLKKKSFISIPIMNVLWMFIFLVNDPIPSSGASESCVDKS